MPRAPLLLVLALASLAAPPARGQDRYGASPAANAPPGGTSAPPSQGPLRARFLSWPGKRVGEPAISAAASGRFAPPTFAAGRDLAAYRAAPVAAGAEWRPVPLQAAAGGRYAAAPAPAAPPALAGAPEAYRGLPTSIYAPRPSASAAAPRPRAGGFMPPPRYRLADRGRDDRVRLYSVHRAYGLQPDPPPIPPQFFGATADLSEPPGPLPLQRAASGAPGGARALRPTDGGDVPAAEP